MVGLAGQLLGPPLKLQDPCGVLDDYMLFGRAIARPSIEASAFTANTPEMSARLAGQLLGPPLKQLLRERDTTQSSRLAGQLLGPPLKHELGDGPRSTVQVWPGNCSALH